MTPDAIDRLAARVLEARRAGRPIPPLTGDEPGLDLAAAYRVGARVLARRRAGGERPVGWKIGFTNRTIWDEYGVHAPIWAPMYDGTVAALAGAGDACPLAGLVEPRIEPEIAFRFAAAPRPGMDEAALLARIDGICHGFEIVQSLFPGWRFRAADTVAAFALHGRFRHGPIVPVPPEARPAWLARLSTFTIALLRDGTVMDEGAAGNVLDGPLSALRHFVDGLPEHPLGRGIEAGDLVTTGTLTRALPAAAGETWSTRLDGLALPGLSMRLA